MVPCRVHALAIGSIMLTRYEKEEAERGVREMPTAKASDGDPDDDGPDESR